MVTSPNWMAPFHIARATAGPHAELVRARHQAGRDRVRMISRAGNPTASRDRAPGSTENDERVEGDASGPPGGGFGAGRGGRPGRFRGDGGLVPGGRRLK